MDLTQHTTLFQEIEKLLGYNDLLKCKPATELLPLIHNHMEVQKSCLDQGTFFLREATFLEKIETQCLGDSSSVSIKIQFLILGYWSLLRDEINKVSTSEDFWDRLIK